MSNAYREFLPTVFGLVRGIRKRFNARASALDMTYSRAQALVNIAGEEGITQVALADRLDIRGPSMNRTLDHLEAAGLIERRAVPEDKRVRQLYLTDVARLRAERIVGFTEDVRAEAYRGIDPEELSQALDVLRRIRANLDDMADQ